MQTLVSVSICIEDWLVLWWVKSTTIASKRLRNHVQGRPVLVEISLSWVRVESSQWVHNAFAFLFRGIKSQIKQLIEIDPRTLISEIPHKHQYRIKWNVRIVKNELTAHWKFTQLRAARDSRPHVIWWTIHMKYSLWQAKINFTDRSWPYYEETIWNLNWPCKKNL